MAVVFSTIHEYVEPFSTTTCSYGQAAPWAGILIESVNSVACRRMGLSLFRRATLLCNTLVIRLLFHVRATYSRTTFEHCDTCCEILPTSPLEKEGIQKPRLCERKPRV